MVSTSACRADPSLWRSRLSGSAIPLVLSLSLLAACAGPGGANPPSSRIARLPPEEMRRLAPATPAPLTADQLVAMVRSGASSQTIVERWREDSPRLAVTPSVIVDLHRRGVPLAVLDALGDAQERALRADLDTKSVQQQAACDARIEQERARPRTCPPPPYGWGPYPYGGWGYPGGPRGGMLWGW